MFLSPPRTRRGMRCDDDGGDGEDDSSAVRRHIGKTLSAVFHGSSLGTLIVLSVLEEEDMLLPLALASLFSVIRVSVESTVLPDH